MADLNALTDRFNEAWNAHDAEAVAQLTAEDAELTVSQQKIHGRAEGKAYNEAWFRGFPDATTKAVKRIISGNCVVEEGWFEGTNTGPFQTTMGEIPATGKRVRGPYCSVNEYEGELIKSSRLYFDAMDVAVQMGVVPMPAGATA